MVVVFVFALLCVATFFFFSFICEFTLGHLCSCMCSCVCLRLYCATWWQAGSWEEEAQEALNKIGSDSLHWCWWKIWLFPSSGVGVWYFKLPLSDNTLDKTRFREIAKWQVRKKRGRVARLLSSRLAPPFQPPQPLPQSPVTRCQHCSNAKTALLPSDINTWILRLDEEETEEVAHRGSGGTVNES